MVGAKAWGSLGAFGTAASLGLFALLLFMNVQTGLVMKDGRAVRPAADDLALVLILDGVGAVLAFTFLAAIYAVRERHAPTFGSLLATVVGVLALGFLLLRAGFEVVATRSVTGDKDLGRDAFGTADAVTDAATALALLTLGLWILMVSAGALRRKLLPQILAALGIVVALGCISVFFIGDEFLEFIVGGAAAWFIGLGLTIPLTSPPPTPLPPPAPLARSTPSPPVHVETEAKPAPLKPTRRKA